ncbi:hypothetical protein ACIOWK_33435 [Pseudomonas protegens]|uniref:hypothetical protein n=1 Tax=Pseudomonas protegens TaxID=380021 RepID=UPI003808C8CA
MELFRLALDGDETYLRNLVFTLIKKANEHYLFAPKGPIDHLKGCEVTANDLLLFIDMLKRGVQPFPRPSVFNGAELKNTISIIESLSGETTAERAGIKLLKSMADKWVIDTEKPDGILLVKNDLDVITDMLKQLYALCRDNSLPTDIYLSPDSSGATGSRSRNDIESILRVLSHDGGAGLRRVFREE